MEECYEELSHAHGLYDPVYPADPGGGGHLADPGGQLRPRGGRRAGGGDIPPGGAAAPGAGGRDPGVL